MLNGVTDVLSSQFDTDASIYTVNFGFELLLSDRVHVGINRNPGQVTGPWLVTTTSHTALRQFERPRWNVSYG